MSLLFVALIVAKHTWIKYSQYAVLHQKRLNLTEELRGLGVENETISKEIAWYGDPAHLEEKAKKELNFKREGEEVFVIIDTQEDRTSSTEEASGLDDDVSWWRRFLGDVRNIW